MPTSSGTLDRGLDQPALVHVIAVVQGVDQHGQRAAALVIDACPSSAATRLLSSAIANHGQCLEQRAQILARVVAAGEGHEARRQVELLAVIGADQLASCPAARNRSSTASGTTARRSGGRCRRRRALSAVGARADDDPRRVMEHARPQPVPEARGRARARTCRAAPTARGRAAWPRSAGASRPARRRRPCGRRRPASRRAVPISAPRNRNESSVRPAERSSARRRRDATRAGDRQARSSSSSDGSSARPSRARRARTTRRRVARRRMRAAAGRGTRRSVARARLLHRPGVDDDAYAARRRLGVVVGDETCHQRPGYWSSRRRPRPRSSSQRSWTTTASASKMIRRDILLAPSRRSTKTIGTSRDARAAARRRGTSSRSGRRNRPNEARPTAVSARVSRTPRLEATGQVVRREAQHDAREERAAARHDLAHQAPVATPPPVT